MLVVNFYTWIFLTSQFVLRSYPYDHKEHAYQIDVVSVFKKQKAEQYLVKSIKILFLLILLD